MPYMQETAVAGKTVEVYKYHSCRTSGKKGEPRAQNRKPTPEQMEKANERNAIKKLRLTIAENFTESDAHIVLTYKKNNRPTTEEARKNIEKFLRDLRRYYKKQEMELKYIVVTEYLNVGIHHHLIINSIDTREITKLWPHGRPHITYLDSEGTYEKLAEYLVKETRKTFKDDNAVMKKRWSCSKNLKQPVIKKKVIKREKWAKEPKPKKGYYIQKDSVVNGTHNYNGYEFPFQFYRMIKYENDTSEDEHEEVRER